jgi:ABC-type transporter Mla MlaB component
MLKISEPSTNHAVTLKLEGRLIGPWVDELGAACEAQLRNSRRLMLDVSDVSYADRAGMALLVTLKQRGIELVNCPPLLAAELKSG